MINPHLALDLRRAQRAFRRGGRFDLADAARIELGRQADAINPDEAPAIHLINIALGGPIHV